MNFNLEDKFYTKMEVLCEKIDYLFEAYATDAFIKYAMAVYTDNIIALDLIKFSFEELDTDDRIGNCRSHIKQDYPQVNEDIIVNIITCILNTLHDWELQNVYENN